MPKGQVIEVNGIRYEAVADYRTPYFESACDYCDYKKDHNGECDAFCCEMELHNCHFKRLDSCK